MQFEAKQTEENFNIEGIEEDFIAEVLQGNLLNLEDLDEEPTPYEIQQSIIEVKRRLPDRSLEQVFKRLYQRFVISKSMQSIQEYQQPIFPPQDIRQQDIRREWLKQKLVQPIHSSQKISQKVWDRYSKFDVQMDRKMKQKIDKNWQYCQNDDNLKRCMQWPTDSNHQFRMYANKMVPRMHTKGEQKKFFTKRRAAMYFCKRDYSIGRTYLKTKKMTGPSANNALNHYQHKTVAVAFIADSFRRYQSFMMDNFDKKLRNLSAGQLQLILYILLNSQNYFTFQQFLTWRRFVKITFDLGSVSIYEQPAKSLYKRIQHCIKERVKQLKQQRQLIENPIENIQQQQNNHFLMMKANQCGEEYLLQSNFLQKQSNNW